MKPWQKWLLAALLITVAIETYLLLRPDPKDKTIQQLQTDNAIIRHQRDSLDRNTATVVQADSILRIWYAKDTTRLRTALDSLQQRQNQAELKYADIKIRLKKTLDDLSASVTDSALMNQLITLKGQLNDASSVVDFLRSNNNAKDSIMANAIEFRDSVIIAQAATIDQLKANYSGIQGLLDRTNADLDVAIAALKKGKKKNILRTVAEAAGVVGLILLLK